MKGEEPSALSINQLQNYQRMFSFYSRLNKSALSQATGILTKCGIILKDVVWL